MASTKTAVGVTITVDPATMFRLRSELTSIKNGVPRAILGAIKKTVPKGRTIVVNRLMELLNVKKKSVIRERVTTRIIKSRLTGMIHIGIRRIGLTHFKGVRDTTNPRTHTGEGVFAQLYRGGASVQFPRGFIAKLRGTATALQRKDLSVVKGGKTHRIRGALVARFPIIPLAGPSPAQVATDHPEIERESSARIDLAFRTELLSQVDRLLKRRKSF